MKNLIIILIAVIGSVVISMCGSYYLFDSNFKDKFDVEWDGKIAAVKLESSKRIEDQIIPAGANTWVSVRSNFGVVAVALSPLMVDLGANSRVGVQFLAPHAVNLKNVTIIFQVAVKGADGKVTWKEGHYTCTVANAPSGEWTMAQLDIPNVSVKEISSLYVMSVKVETITAKE